MPWKTTGCQGLENFPSWNSCLSRGEVRWACSSLRHRRRSNWAHPRVLVKGIRATPGWDRLAAVEHFLTDSSM